MGIKPAVKKERLTAFLNDLLTSCASGTEFKFDKKRREHKLSSEAATHIKKNYVSKSANKSFIYVWKASTPVTNIVESMTKIKNKDLKKTILTHANGTAPAGQHIIKSSVRLDTPQADTKKEVKSIQTEMRFDEKPSKEVAVEATVEEVKAIQNTNVEVRIMVEKRWGNGHRESISYPVSGKTYNQLKDEVSKQFK